MDSQTIRQKFLQYFIERGHLELASLPLVPADPNITTLFTIAGMQQMIPFFLGEETPPSPRLVTDQQVVRTVDIEEVGDESHLTWYEMLGNFSVGDYFKHEAIGFTWDFLTREMALPADRFWATIYPGDEEAREGWLAVGLLPERISETEENWWSQGPTGPCGPDSEIFWDRGVEYGCGLETCSPAAECCHRFLEIWNNVFMTYNRSESGDLKPLPRKNIDTGMGFERLVMVQQGAETVYGTDLFQPIIRRVAGAAGIVYGETAGADRSLRIIADHSRAIAFMAADNVMPSAEGRGYVLRRLIRRAALRGRLLGIERPFLTEPVGTVIETMGGYWTQLAGRRDHILAVVGQEEERFLHTLSRGLGIFDDVAGRAASDSGTIRGEDAFSLKDTYGFPLELTQELAAERGLSVDQQGFERALSEQQERGRRDHAFSHGTVSPETYATVAQRVQPPVFTGYDELRTASEITAILAEGQMVPQAQAGDQVEILLGRTPFYAESGGQVGDTGTIRTDTGLARVLDTQRRAGLIVHVAEVAAGTISVGDAAVGEVDTERRLHVLPHHSGTHLLHKALQEVLGPDAVQAGSLVAPDRLRFDFRWPQPLNPEQLDEVQDRVNAAIWANLPVQTQVQAYDDALHEGAMALFGEKYGDRVRVVSMGEWSKELCGGTHVKATGDIGLLLITSETGTGSGVRRIEALAGAAAYGYINNALDERLRLARTLETKPDHLLPRAEGLMATVREQEKRIEALNAKLAAREADRLIAQGTSVDGITVVADRISADSVDFLQAATDAVRDRLGQGAVVLGTVIEGKPAFTMAVTPALKQRGLEANRILREAARVAGGGAGGTADFAQGGGRDASRIDDVLHAAVEVIKSKVEG